MTPQSAESGVSWEGLTPPYSTIVADPPWAYDEGWPGFGTTARVPEHARRPLPYSALSVEAISLLPVADLAAEDAHLYLWTTNRYLRSAFDVVQGWGFRPSQVLVWCKPPMGVGPGGSFSNTTEFVLFGRRGSLAHKERHPTSWWEWSRDMHRSAHSSKPPAFLDVVESVSPGPYVELFCRTPRFGWDSWGLGFESEVA